MPARGDRPDDVLAVVQGVSGRGRNGLTRETLRDATTEKVRGWKEDNASLKEALAESILARRARWKEETLARRRAANTQPLGPEGEFVPWISPRKFSFLNLMTNNHLIKFP